MNKIIINSSSQSCNKYKLPLFQLSSASPISQRFNEESLKTLSKQIESVFSPQPQKFKNKFKIQKFRTKPENNSLEEIKKILDEDSPHAKKFITAEIMQKNTIFRILKSRKRQFGCNLKILEIPHHKKENFNAQSNIVSSKLVSKKLNAILYNNLYRTSNKFQNTCFNETLSKKFKANAMRNATSRQVSPTNLESGRRRSVRKSFINKEFKHMVDALSLENNLLKLKLSKF